MVNNWIVLERNSCANWSSYVGWILHMMISTYGVRSNSCFHTVMFWWTNEETKRKLFSKQPLIGIFLLQWLRTWNQPKWLALMEVCCMLMLLLHIVLLVRWIYIYIPYIGDLLHPKFYHHSHKNITETLWLWPCKSVKIFGTLVTFDPWNASCVAGSCILE